MKQTRVMMIVALACLTCGALAQQQEYLHTVYWGGLRPTIFRGSEPVVDLSTYERVSQILGELSELGVNVVAYHSVYGNEGALFPVDDPILTESWQWPEGTRPVENFLDACEEHGIEGFLGIWMGQEGHRIIAEHAIDAILERYGDHPALGGIVPPIEAPYTGVTTDDFIALSRQVKRYDRSLRTMDYPPSPYTFKQLHWLMKLATSGAVDIENVQFHACDDRLADLREARGLAMLTVGCCPNIRSIIHTHYKNGVNTPENPTDWLPPERAWDVTQSALITATPDGTSIFSFLHGFWGEASGPAGGDAMWRRLKWYEGILGVQRMLPLYAGAESRERIQIMVPTGTLENAQDLLARCWLPLARRHVPCSFFVDQRNISSAAEVIIVPSFERCDANQARLLQRFAAEGGTVIATAGLHASTTLYASLAEAGAISPHVREVLDLYDRPDVAPGDIDPEFALALGFEGGPLAEAGSDVRTRYGRGQVILAPGEPDWTHGSLASTAIGAAPSALRVQGLPDGWVVERWQAPDGPEFVALLGIDEGLSAEGVRIEAKGLGERAWLLLGEGAQALAVENGAVTLPAIGDSFALVALDDLGQPIVRPSVRTVRCSVGDEVVFGVNVLNATGRRAVGSLTAQAPDGWRIEPEGAHYDLAPGERLRVELALTVPDDAVRRPWFVRINGGDQVQRVIIFPEDGAPQVISELSEPLRGTPPPGVAEAPGDIGDEWLSVTAGEIFDDVLGRHVPGVSFFSAEWAPPEEKSGRLARYGELIRPRMGGPNFWVNRPDLERDLLVRVTALTPDGGVVQLYDGASYHVIGELAASEEWQTREFRADRAIFATEGADHSREPGLNLLGQFSAPAIWVHEIAVRAAPD